MKAAVLNQAGDDKLELRDDVMATDPGPDEVKIRVGASGIGHSDLSAMNDGMRVPQGGSLVRQVVIVD